MRIPKGCLQEVEAAKSKSAIIHHFWDILCAASGDESSFPLRYAAYIYYRSRGWIVRPSLCLGGVDFLLYAEGPPWRHAAFAVLVEPSAAAAGVANRAASDISAHLRVTASVAKVGGRSNYVLMLFLEIDCLSSDCRANRWTTVGFNQKLHNRGDCRYIALLI